MLRILMTGLAVLCLISLLVLREWSVSKELASIEQHLSGELSHYLSEVEDSHRLQNLQSSSFVYRRFIEPHLMVASRLIWFPTRDKKLLAWERKVHQELQDRSYQRARELRSQLDDRITQLRLQMEPSRERLLEVFEVSQLLQDRRDRQEIFQLELRDIQSQTERHDRDLIQVVRTIGVDKLQQLQRVIRDMDESEFVDFLASAEFFQEILQPVSDKVLELRQDSLRKSTWSEFQRNLVTALSRKQQRIARQRPEEIERQDRLQSMTELLRREYQREVDGELSRQDPTMLEPSGNVHILRDLN